MHRLYTGVHYYLQVCHEPAIANQLYYHMRKATPKYKVRVLLRKLCEAAR